MHSTTTAYVMASKSTQPGHMYREVLLACALAPTDELGYFSSADLKKPMAAITGNTERASGFTRHLREFANDKRGALLKSSGPRPMVRYRFSSPLMRPYIVMKAFADKQLTRDAVLKILV
jgi:hypothetical protein